MASVDRRDGADLIVVGASAGGLTAAVIAADRGCHVVLIERGKDLGGAAGITGEPVAAAGSRWQREAGVTDDPGRLAADLLAAGVAAEDGDLLRALSNHSAPLVEWLADRCGVDVGFQRATQAPHTVARLHALGEHGGASLVAALGRIAGRHHRIRLRATTEVTQLLGDASGVTGVAVKPDRRGPPTIAGRVLLACGGFVADDGLVATHCAPAAALPVGGPATATGDGLRLATGLGARTRHLDRCDVTALFAMPAQLEVPATLLGLGAILVNQAGQRFADAGIDALALAGQVRAQPGHVAYLVFDDRVAAAASADPFVEHVILPKAGRRGVSATDLARQLELSAEGLEATVAGTPLAAPFRAVRVSGARLRTLGGLVVDAAARVIGAEGQPIPGLYAAGGVTVTLAAGPAGLAALSALGQGRLAAQDVIAACAAAKAAD